MNELIIIGKSLAMKNHLFLEQAKTLVEIYIKVRTGEVVHIDDINPKEKFEKAVTIATNYFNSL